MTSSETFFKYFIESISVSMNKPTKNAPAKNALTIKEGKNVSLQIIEDVFGQRKDL